MIDFRALISKVKQMVGSPSSIRFLNAFRYKKRLVTPLYEAVVRLHPGE